MGAQQSAGLTSAEYIGLILGASTLSIERWSGLPLARKHAGVRYACRKLGLTFEQVDPVVFSNAVRSLLCGDAEYLRAVIDGFEDD